MLRRAPRPVDGDGDGDGDDGGDDDDDDADDDGEEAPPKTIYTNSRSTASAAVMLNII